MRVYKHCSRVIALLHCSVGVLLHTVQPWHPCPTSHSGGAPSSTLAASVHAALRREHGIEVPVACAGGRMWCRISVQIYNELSGELLVVSKQGVSGAGLLVVAPVGPCSWLSQHSMAAAKAGAALLHTDQCTAQHQRKHLPYCAPFNADYQKLADAVTQLAAELSGVPEAPAVPAPP